MCYRKPNQPPTTVVVFFILHFPELRVAQHFLFILFLLEIIWYSFVIYLVTNSLYKCNLNKKKQNEKTHFRVKNQYRCWQSVCVRSLKYVVSGSLLIFIFQCSFVNIYTHIDHIYTYLRHDICGQVVFYSGFAHTNHEHSKKIYWLEVPSTIVSIFFIP